MEAERVKHVNSAGHHALFISDLSNLGEYPAYWLVHSAKENQESCSASVEGDGGILPAIP